MIHQMQKLCFLVLISIVWSHDVYRFTRDDNKAPSPLKSQTDCPDDSECDSGQTCCQMVDGSYGCCSFQNAVCCSDKIHCCPEHTTCDLVHAQCKSKENKFVSFLKIKVQNKKGNRCPGNGYLCDEKQTCCPGRNEPYSCCPISNGVCCTDRAHCCPEGAVCDIARMICIHKSNILSVVKLKSVSFPVKSNKCPDNSQCRNEETCCPESDGKYGCCPFANAVCCSDHAHCCPHGTTCNLDEMKCEPKGNKCPDNSQCRNEETCCPESDGNYGCCPFANAVCCSDHAHCCPQGTTCNLNEMKCEPKGNTYSLMRRKTVTIPVKSVVCPDGSQCTDLETCCQLKDGGYGCCPEENAVCCSDKVHCCPQNTTCNLVEMRCDSKDSVIISLIKPKTASNPLKSIRCPDNTQCGDGETCCLEIDGKYGCCPRSNAVCCSDKIHCCPEGTSCNVAENKCDSVGNSTSFMKRKTASIPIKSVTCPDNTQCEDDSTCCPTGDGTYSCCETSNAVCCADHLHCCPYGTTCNLSNHTCDGFHSMKKMETNSLTYKP